MTTPEDIIASMHGHEALGVLRDKLVKLATDPAEPASDTHVLAMWVHAIVSAFDRNDSYEQEQREQG